MLRGPLIPLFPLVLVLYSCGHVSGPFVDLFRDDEAEDEETTSSPTSDDPEPPPPDSPVASAPPQSPPPSDILVATIGSPRFRTAAEVFAVAAHGSMVASGHGDGVLRVWTSDGDLRWQRHAHDGGVRGIAVAGAELLTVGWDGRLLRWRNHQSQTVEQRDRPLLAVAARGPVVASGGLDGRVVVRVEEEVRVEWSHEERVADVEVSQDGSTVAAASWDRTVRIVQLDTPTKAVKLRHPDPVFAVAFSSDAKTVATGGRAGTITLWTIDGRKLRSWVGHATGVTSIAFVGEWLVSTGANGQVARWSATGKSIWRAAADDRELRASAHREDRLLVGGASGQMRAVSWSDGRVSRDPTSIIGPITALAIAPDGRRIAAGSAEGVQVFTIDGELETRVQTEGARSVAFGSDATVLVASPTGQVVAAGRDGKVVFRRVFAKSPTFVKLSKDGTQIAFAEGGRVRIELTKHKKLVRSWGRSDALDVTFQPPALLSSAESGVSVNGAVIALPDAPVAAALSPNATDLVATLRADDTHHDLAFGAASGKDGETRTVRLPAVHLNQIAVAAAARWVAVGGPYRHVRREIRRGKTWTLQSAPNPDAVAPRLIELKTGRAHILPGHDGGTDALAFSNDGAMLATGGCDGMIRVWRLPSSGDSM